MIERKKLISTEYSLYIKGEKYLFVFPEVPYWLIVGKFGKNVIDAFCNVSTLEESFDYIKMLCKENELSEKQIEFVTTVYKRLEIDNIFSFVKHERLQVFTKEIDSIGINVTRNCNLQCKYCYLDANKNRKKMGAIDYVAVEKFLRGAYKFKSENCYLQITGGEPLLEKELTLQILESATLMGYDKITLNTNGMMLDTIFAGKLAKFDSLKNVTISIDGEKGVHDLYRGKGSYESALCAIKSLRKQGINVTASMTVHNGNLQYLEEFILFCKEYDVQSFTNPMFPIGRGKESENLIGIEIEKVFDELLRIYIQERDVKKVESTFLETIIVPLRDLRSKHYCGLGLTSAFLDVDGCVYPCANTLGVNYFNCGNIFTESFEEIWINSAKYDEIRTKIDVDKNKDCKKCDLKYICAGFCRGMNYQLTKEINTKSVWCESLKKTILKGLWTISEYPELFSNMQDKFL